MSTVRTDMRNNQLLGLFGGTFDPIHHGHLLPVIQSAAELAIDKVFILPCHIPPHKLLPGINASHRLNMVKLAVQDIDLFEVDDYELQQDAASYSVNTLKHYKQTYPEKHLCFFIGMDSLLNFNKWYQWQQILQLCHLVVCHRPGYELEQLPRELAPFTCHTADDLYATASGKILLQQMQLVDISSTELRQLVTDGQHSPYLDDKVQEYIRQHRLYSC